MELISVHYFHQDFLTQEFMQVVEEVDQEIVKIIEEKVEQVVVVMDKWDQDLLHLYMQDQQVQLTQVEVEVDKKELLLVQQVVEKELLY
jgi:predicted GTPase